MSDKNLCFFTVAQGKYQSFIPLFLYSISESYPDFTTIVFTGGEPAEPYVVESIELLSDRNVDVITDEFSGYKSGGRVPAMWRFLLFTTERFEKYFSNFNYFYTTDVDFIICPETPSLLTQHLTHCNTLSLPYSASLRHYYPEIIVARLFATRSFALCVQDQVDIYDKLVEEHGSDIFDETPRHFDERLLYEIVTKSGFRSPPKLDPYSISHEFDLFDPANYDRELFSPHHGIHLGIGRKKRGLGGEMWMSLFNRDFYQGYAEQLSKFQSDPLFVKLLSITPDYAVRLVSRMIEVLDKCNSTKDVPAPAVAEKSAGMENVGNTRRRVLSITLLNE